MVEIQLHLAEIYSLKSGGGHKQCAVAPPVHCIGKEVCLPNGSMSTALHYSMCMRMCIAISLGSYHCLHMYVVMYCFLHMSMVHGNVKVDM